MRILRKIYLLTIYFETAAVSVGCVLQTLTVLLHKSSPYRSVNTLCLGYKNQPVNVVQGNSRCLF